MSSLEEIRDERLKKLEKETTPEKVLYLYFRKVFIYISLLVLVWVLIPLILSLIERLYTTDTCGAEALCSFAEDIDLFYEIIAVPLVSFAIYKIAMLLKGDALPRLDDLTKRKILAVLLTAITVTAVYYLGL